MDYEKKYNDLVNDLKKLWNCHTNNDQLLGELAEICPELRESEEDEKKMIFLERLIEYNVPDGQYGWADGRKGGFVTKSEAISMLKSLRPVSKDSLQSWKPSEEQIYAIVEALKYLPNNKDEWRILNTLVDVFKKLM